MRGSAAVIGEMVRKEFYQIRQDKRMLGVSIVAPFVMVLLLGYAATTDITNSTLAVKLTPVDKKNTIYGYREELPPEEATAGAGGAAGMAAPPPGSGNP